MNRTGKKQIGPLFEQLERRVLLSADPVLNSFDDLSLTPEPGRNDSVSGNAAADVSAALDTGTHAPHRITEVFFIDSRVPDALTLIEDLQGRPEQGLEIALLDARTSGIDQISEALAQYRGLDAVHVISHGSQGTLQLGNGTLDLAVLEENAEAIQGWGESFTENGDLLFYGCDLAATQARQDLVDALAYLSRTDVSASEDLTGSASLGGDWNLEYQRGIVETEVAFSTVVRQGYSNVLAATGQSLWISTEQDVPSPSGLNGIATEAVASSEILALGAPNLAMEPETGTTNGTFSRVVDFDPMVIAGSSRINGLHHVGRDLTVGSNELSLSEGDVLFTLFDATTTTLQNSDLTTLDVQWNDIVQFRPDSPGNYTSGTYSILVDGSDLGFNSITGFTLVEQSTTVGQGGGATTLDAGDILFVDWNGVASDAHIQRLEPDTLGDNTTGITSILVDGNDLSADLGLPSICGLDLVEEDTLIGSTLLLSGQILLTLPGTDDIGGISAGEHDIVVLDVTTTGPNSAATATMLFDGSDVGLDAWQEDIRGLSLVVTGVNNAPSVTSNGGGATASINVTENTTAVTTVTATDPDLDTPTYSISGGADAGLFDIDTNTGVLTFNIAPDFENPTDSNIDNTYVVEVAAADGNGGIDVQSISVTIADASPTALADTYSVNANATLDVNWWDTNWARRQQLTFDNLAQSETLTDFPVLIVLNTGNIDYAQTKDDGSDLRFFAADGSALAHEIEQWNEAGDSSVWVRVPQIAGNSSSDSIWMYYGNPAAESVSQPGNVWDNNFVGVWHLNEDQVGIGTAGVYADSTSRGNDGIDRVAATGQEGQVTGGQQFGSNDWIETDHDASLDLRDSMTISFWVKPTSDSGNYNRVVEKGLWGYNDSYYFGGGDGLNDLAFWLNGQEVIETADNVLTVGVWQHAAVSYTSNGDGTGTARLYIDGSEIATGNYTSGTVVGNTGRLAIGHDDPNYDFDGLIDEVQISNTARSADWIAAQYRASRNQFGAEFVQFNVEESTPALGGVLTNDLPGASSGIRATNLDTSSAFGLVTLKPDGTLTYDPNGQFDYLDEGETATDTFTYDVTEPNGSSTTATVTITIAGVNDPPTLTATGSDPSFVIGGSAVDLFAGVSISTVESGQTIQRLELSVTNVTDGADEVLNIDRTPVALGITGSGTTATNNYLYSVNLAGSTATIVVGSSGANAADIEALVETLNYENVSAAPTLGSRVITLERVQDSGGNANGGSDLSSVAIASTVQVVASGSTLWLSADEDSVSGADGLPGGWTQGEVLQFGGPDLALGASTDGDFASVIDFDAFAVGSVDTGALHFVSRNITVGSGADSIDLRIGDVLVSFNQDEDILAAYYETGVQTTVHRNDLLLFRPDTLGDYSLGTFYTVLNGVPDPLGSPISSLHAISLVEQDTVVGSTLLSAGTFLYSTQSGIAPNTPNHIYHLAPTTAGKAAAAGISQILIDGDDIDLQVGSNIRGLEFVENAATIGGMNFSSGDILVTLSVDDASVGNAPVLNTSTSDVFVLRVAQAEPETGNTTAATAEMVFDGSDVNFSGSERVYAIALHPDNVRPQAQDDRVGLSFDGVDDYVQVANDPSLVMTNTLTMEAWVNLSPTASGGSQLILNKEGEYELGVTADTGEIKWAIAEGGAWGWRDTGVFLTKGEWTHVAVTYNAGVVLTYVNGALVHTYSQTGPIDDVYPGFNEFRIGGRENATTQRFDGQIDEVRIWNVTRTEGEIKASNDSPLAGSEPGLVGYWRFDEGTGSQVLDRSPSGNHGTLGGSDGAAAEPAWTGYVTNEDTVLNVPVGSGVLGNDLDVDGDPLTVTNVDTSALLGSITVNADGSFSYDPRGAFDSLAPGQHVTDSFTYTANDGTGDSNRVTVTITVTGVNDAPTFSASGTNPAFTEGGAAVDLFSAVSVDTVESGQTIERVMLTVSNVVDGSNEILNIDGTVVALTNANTGTTANNGYNFSVSVTGSTASVGLSTIGATPAAAQALVDTLSYQNNGSPPTQGNRTVTLSSLQDSGGSVYGGSDLVVPNITSTVSIGLVPTALNDANTASEGGFSVSGNVISNDNQGDAPATVTAATQGGTVITIGNPFVTTNGGSLTLNSDGSYTYTPPAQGSVPPGGLTEVFNYTITDADGDISSATLTITVTDNDLLPAAVNDTNAATEAGIAASGNVITNDTQGDAPATVTAADHGGNAIPIGSAFTTANGGSLTLNSDGSYSYTPPPQGSVPPAGLVEVFNYTITDVDGDSDTATLMITVTDNDLTPTAANDSTTAVEAGANATGNVISNDTQGDASATVTAADQGGSAITVGSAFTTANGGSLTLNSDGSYTYAPPVQGNVPAGGLAEVFTYTITDADGDTSSATLTITVNNNDLSPGAVADSYSTDVNTALTTGNVLSNDGLGDAPVTVSAFDTASVNGGTVTYNGDGTFNYTPAIDFTGSDTFTYTLTDADGDGSSATVTVTVTAASPPVTTDPSPQPPPSSDDPTPSADPVDPPPTRETNGSGDTDDAAEDELLPTSEDPTDRSGGTAKQASDTEEAPLEETEEVTAEPAEETEEVTAEAAAPTEEAVAEESTAQAPVEPEMPIQVMRPPVPPSNTPPITGLRALEELPLMASPEFVTALDDIRAAVEEDAAHEKQQLQFAVAGVTATGLSLTAGFVTWAIRGGSLLATLVAGIPAWKGFDPLPVVSGARHGRNEFLPEGDAEDSPTTETEDDRVDRLFDERAPVPEAGKSDTERLSQPSKTSKVERP